MEFLGARNLAFSSHSLCLQRMSPVPKLSNTQSPIFTSPAPDLSSKLQTHISRYLLVISTCMSFTISPRKCPKRIQYLPPSAPFHTSFLIAHFSKGTSPSHSIAYDTKLETIGDLSLPHHLHLFSHQVLLILSSKYIFNISISLHLHYPHLSHIYLLPGLHICFLVGLFTSTLVLLCPLP